MSPAAAAYLNAAIDLMQQHSINRHKVHWEPLRAEAFEVARKAQTPADTYRAISAAVYAAGGKHSFLVTPDQAKQLQNSMGSDYPAPRGRLLLGKLGFVAIGTYASPNPEEGTKYATSAQQVIRELDAQKPCGWLVDLRADGGGNMWPMLAGLGPILGEGKAGAFIDPDGESLEWGYQGGKATQASTEMAAVDGPPYQLQAGSPPVAVLTGKDTASSGEALVVAFRGRPNTRSFGSSTAGFSTANGFFPLSDGAGLALTMAVFVDRTGQTYGDKIVPDEDSTGSPNQPGIDETVPQDAIDWLLSQPACAGRK